MQEKETYNVQKKVRHITIGLASLTVISAPLFIWFAILFAIGTPKYIELGDIEQVIMAIVGFVGFSCLAGGSIYAFIPPLAEVESLEIIDNSITIRRTAMPPLTFTKGVSFTVKRILTPNYTDDKSRKNFEAYLYVSWPIVFVVSERIEGYGKLNKMLQGNAT